MKLPTDLSNLSSRLLTQGPLPKGQVALMVKNPPANAGDLRDTIGSLSWKDFLEEGMETHSSILAWRIPWTESL